MMGRENMLKGMAATIAIVVVSVTTLAFFVGASCGPPTPNPTPTPTPAAECVCDIPGPDDPGWSAATVPSDETIWNVPVFEDIRFELGDTACTGKTNEQLLDLFAATAQARGLCAARWKDSVLMSTPSGTRFEEVHAVSYARNCWASSLGVVKGSWQHPQAQSCPFAGGK